MEPLVDRRKFQRFNVNGGAVAVLEPFPIKMGRVMDISKGGIEIRYFEEEAWPEDFSALSILMSVDQDIRLENIPVIMVDDLEIHNDNPSVVEKRRRSLRFGHLSADQTEKLEKFIREHTDCATEPPGDIAV